MKQILLQISFLLYAAWPFLQNGFTALLFVVPAPA